MARYRIKIDREKCMGMGVCVLSASEIFDQDEDCKAIALTAEFDEITDALDEAVHSCPTRSIELVEKTD